jgi:hypothetical protein
MTAMSVERLERLLWANLDGELDAQELAELQAYVAGDPDAQELERELAWLSLRFDAVPVLAAPPELRPRIERALATLERAQAPVSPAAAGNRRSLLDVFTRPGWLPQLAFAAAGLLAGLALYPILAGQGRELDPGQFYGAMGSEVSAAGPALRLELPEGSLALRRRGVVLFAELELRGDGETELHLAFAAGTLELEAQSQTGSGSRLEVGADSLGLWPAGAGRYQLQVDAEAAVLPLEVVVKRRGETVVSRQLAWGDIPELPG